MSTYVFSLNDISVEDGSPVVSVNNSDSFFGLIEGSQLFIAGKLPATIIDHDTTANTLTLKYNWQQGDLSNVAAQVVPIGAVGVLLQALENNRAAYAAFLETMAEWSGDINWVQLIDPPVTATQWPDFTQVTGTLGENQLPSAASTKRDVMRVSPAFDTSKGRQAFEHNHYDQLAKNVSPLPPAIGPLKPVELHFDTTQKKTWVMWGHNKEDAQPIEQYLGRRNFYQADSPVYIDLDSPFTGDVTMRVYVFHVTIDSVTHLSGTHEIKGLPGSPTLTLGQWVTFTASVTNLPEIGNDGMGNYFFGLVDYISFSDGKFADLSKPYFPRIPQLNATITNTSNNASNPFITCNQRLDGTWETADITPNTPMTIYSSWVQDGRKFTATAVSEANDRVEFFSSSYLDGKTVEYAVALHSLVGYGSLATLNANANAIEIEGVKIFTATSERLALKRGYGEINAVVEVLYIKQLIPEVF
ncbi:hypothetical protein E5672_07395 [Alteromonas portus]|uniref:Uncharacterized protein n=1 Tax=Alteromonas portus TaxID=2565549 RepID=A0A4V5NR93_9ALTE|nr:hypothetical protein [Alteromonas portus]TKB03904.1 hypothetical protein E5672_07395 [Alteromonas portus]